MEYKRAGDAYSFECCMFKISIIGDIEKIEFNDNAIGKANIDGAFSELKRLKEIRAENEVAAEKSITHLTVNLSGGDDKLSEIYDAIGCGHLRKSCGE